MRLLGVFTLSLITVGFIVLVAYSVAVSVRAHTVCATAGFNESKATVSGGIRCWNSVVLEERSVQ